MAWLGVERIQAVHQPAVLLAELAQQRFVAVLLASRRSCVDVALVELVLELVLALEAVRPRRADRSSGGCSAAVTRCVRSVAAPQFADRLADVARRARGRGRLARRGR